MSCNHAYDNLEEIKKIYRGTLLQQARGLQKHLLQLNETISEFESLSKAKPMYQSSIKITLSILFILCLLSMPYGYYQAVRFLGMLGFVLLAYFSYQQQQKVAVIVYIALGLLFQPFIKIALGRTIWNAVDVIIAVGLILSLFYKPKKVI